MHTVKPGVLAHTIKKMSGYIVKSKLDIPVWNAVFGKHPDFGETVYDENTACVFHTDDRFKLGYDDTVLFSQKVVIPDYMDGDKIYFKADFGGEALVKINGKYVGTLTSEHRGDWSYRNEIIVTNNAKAGEELFIEVEDTVCCGIFCNSAMAGAKYEHYTIEETCLYAADTRVEDYWFEVATKFRLLDIVDDAIIKTKVYNAIDDSIHTLDFDFDRERFSKSVDAAAKVLHDGLANISYIPQGKLTMVGHSHLDIAWLWTSRELSRKCARTFSSTLALMNQYPGFKFTQSQAIVYDYAKKYYPGIYAGIKEAVKQGKWEIVGNAWVEADTNIASGESLVRQLLYGRKFFKDEFGVVSDTYWLPDCFGFSWALPQIIKRSGMKFFATSKLQNNDTNTFPYTVCRWKGQSGDEIIAYLNKVGYGSEYEPEYIKRCFERNGERALTESGMGMFGYGDGGGGATYFQLEEAKYTENFPGIPDVKIGTTRDFFEPLAALFAELPVWDGDMYYENHRGTYTTHHDVKKNNRKLEFAMRDIEIFKNLFGFTDIANQDELDEYWKKLLTNQFHDILPGTSIHEVFDDVTKEYAKLRGFRDDCLIKLSGYLKKDERKITVFNTLPFVRSEYLTVLTAVKYTSVSDGETLYPVDFIEAQNGYMLRFRADKVPACGCKTFIFGDREPFAEKKLKVSKTLLENDYIKIILDENGLIDSMYDKENDREVLCGKGNLLTVYTDKCVHETAWNLEADYVKHGWELTKADSIEVVSDTLSLAAVKIVRSFNKSTVTQILSIIPESKQLDIDTWVDWYETEKVLKAAFPVTVRNTFASYEMAHGTITHPTHKNTSYDGAKFEVCGHKFADLSEGDYGVSILNDCKYGYNIHNNIMEITLLRSSTCPDTTADKGTWDFVYSVLPHGGDWRAETVEAAHALNVPMYVFDGESELSGKSLLSFSRNDIVLDAVKRAEDGRGLIVRVYESKQSRGKCEAKLAFPLEKVIETNLMEDDETEIPVTCGGFEFNIKPFEVKTFRIFLKGE